MNCLICGKETVETGIYTMHISETRTRTGFMQDTITKNLIDVIYPVHDHCLKTLKRQDLIAKCLFSIPFVLIVLAGILSNFFENFDLIGKFYIYFLIFSFIIPFPAGIILLIFSDRRNNKLEKLIKEYYHKNKK